MLIQGMVSLSLSEVLLSAAQMQDSEDHSALIYAATTGNSDVLETLLEAGMGSVKTASTALQEAVKNGHAESTRILLSAGASVNELNSYGWSFLHVACSKSCPANDGNLVTLLIRAGANVEQFVKYSSLQSAMVRKATPLMVAAMADKHREVAALLAGGACIAATDPDFNRTALHCAIACGSTLASQVLLTAGANISARDGTGCAPVHFLGHPHYKNTDTDSGLEALGALLVNHKANFNARDDLERTPLHHIIANYNENCGARAGSKFKVLGRLVEFMLSVNADVNAYDNERNSILHYLIKLHARISGQFNSPLKPGSEDHRQFMAVFQRLVQGANVKFRNNRGFTPAQLLNASKNTKLMEVEMNRKLAPFFVALVAAPDGDRSWDAVPLPCPGLGEALYSVWLTTPDELGFLFARLEESLKPVARIALLYLHRSLSGCKGLQMQILSYALC